ncbi:hypothetical protein [Methanosarcina sp. 2.H.A.1B.4]|uniref:hypothetical protein n=1 Tax=Methanosarcina sp. 2.H.A.1B.4 TaxID=1483600 RepID=UPI00062136A3|nr:hypothetical protein [Methanosarcina sp. 2.H.A.1B.4]KKG07784.1 hypothetical protein EO92_04315 [Methanosarcina sp. 2.H.A.1B.4]
MSKMVNIELPELEKKDYPQICFIKKYRHQGTTRYTFLNIATSKEISKTLLKWLEKNFQSIVGKTIVPYNPSIPLENLESVDLRSLQNWQYFEQKAFTLNENENDLDKIKKHLVGFMIYLKKGNTTYGQIRRTAPSSVLNKKGVYNVYFGESIFNEIKEEKEFKIDDKADLIFKHSEDASDSIIFDKENFKLIFDMKEEEKREALLIIETFEIFSTDGESLTKIKVFVENDRTLQSMLINPSFKDYINEIDFQVLRELKEEVQERICFELDHENGKLILPEGNEKQAVKDLIKSISGRYNRSLNKKHVLENGNVMRVLK